MPNFVNWNGTSSLTLGADVYVEGYPRLSIPKRKTSVYSVPGRNGDIVFQQDAWENFEQNYDIFFGHTITSNDALLRQKAEEVASWLFSRNGYGILTDSYDNAETFHLAYFVGPVDVESRLSRLGRCTITFTCRPERFYYSGLTEIAVTATETAITNPTVFASKPLVKVEGTGNGTVTVGTSTMTITGMTDYLYIDCEDMDVFRQIDENMNSLVSGTFFTIPGGSSVVEFTGGITGVTITPRWWSL